MTCNVCAFCACLLVYSLILQVKCLEFKESKHPATSNRHTLVRPSVHHARTKRQLSTTRQESGSHHHELTVTVNVEGEPNTLDLKINHGMLPEGHTISYQEGGETVLHKPKKMEMDFCQYTGQVRGKPNSWVALSTCHGLRGAINDGSKTRYIEPVEERDLQSPHYLYEQSELTEGRCGNDDLYPQKSAYNKLLQKTKTPSHEKITQNARHKRQASFTIRGGPFNATERSRYVELVLVTDYAIYEGLNGDLKRLYHHLQETTNILHAIYSRLNIFIALTGVEVWTLGDRITLSHNGSRTLDNFMKYRREVLMKNMPHHDHAQLITATNFLKGVVGEAYISKMTTSQSGAIIHQQARHVSAATIASTAATMAHEMGHNFGMSHDTNDSRCQDKYCIMHGSAVYPIPTHFSEDSLKELMMGFHQGIDYGLRNKPTKLFGSPSCGNGFVDPGEECDCGVRVEGLEPNGCSRCCNPGTCRLRSNATCATGVCCNLETCQIKPVATMCRAADRECDLPEYCPGDSEYCPEDLFKMDTTPCSHQAYCVQGKCRSHDTQCQLLFGRTAKSGKKDCYKKNTIGDDMSNCGYDPLTQRSQRCGQRDASCGRLYCHHYSTKLEFGSFDAHRRTFYSSSYVNGFSMCEAVRVDVGNSVDPGMVPDGAECGAGQMCLQQQCVPVDDVRAQITQHHLEGCRANCSGHGICNSNGQCHCDDGFAPPLCDLPGVGGSDDSGPAVDPNVQKTFKLVMYIIFLGIVPLIALILLLIYFLKWKPLLCCGQNNKFHRSISYTTSAKKAVLSVFNNKDSNIKSTNTSTVVNGNAKESIKNIAKHDIRVIRNVQTDAALQSKFDVNTSSYVKYRNGRQEAEMKINKDDIKVIHSDTVDDLPKPVLNRDINFNRNNIGVRKVNDNLTVNITVEHTRQIKPDSIIISTHTNLAIPPKHSAGNSNNVVSDTSVVKQATVADEIKIDLQPKLLDNKVNPIPHSKPTNIYLSNNVNPKVDGNINSRPQNLFRKEVMSHSITPSSQAMAKRPTEKKISNTVPNLRTVKYKVQSNNSEIKCQPKQKVTPLDKPIPHQK